MNKLELEKKIELTNKYDKLIKENINNIEKKYMKIKCDKKKYYRYLKYPNIKTDFAYITIIFCDSKYISSIIVTGFYLKYIIKTKYNIICLVQDTPYYEIDISGLKTVKFPGLTKEEINDIKKIYDVVIGIDILNILTKEGKQGWELLPQYKNLIYYSTKLLCLGLDEYNKLIYYDSSSLITKNIDFLFNQYELSTRRLDFFYIKQEYGLIGNFIFIIPKLYYIEKGIFLIQNYENIFKNYNLLGTKDEHIIYYSIYPNWNIKLLNENLFSINYIRYSNIDVSKEEYYVEFYMGIKPFLFPFNIDVNEKNKFYLNHNCYYYWDLCVKQLLKKFHKFNKYFKFIKTFRTTGF